MIRFIVQVTPKQLLVVLLPAALAMAGVWFALTWTPAVSRAPQTPSGGAVSASGYADGGACARCHSEIADTYRRTGMGRSFARIRAGQSAADFKNNNRFYHRASDRHYTMLERDGRLYQRRHQTGFEGKETNAIESEAAYVVGSGNHAQTFLHRTADGRLLQMPVSWYAERGGYWAMSPGYDKPAQLDFRRVIDSGCMSCHNGYPRTSIEDDGLGPKFAPPAAPEPGSNGAGEGGLPEGIDCQRCHGPGQAHIDAIGRNDLDAARRAIVNPATLDRDRQLETCMQCHLEPTSSPLPFQTRRYEHPPFSFSPGKTLSDYFIYFDHAPGSGRDDKFEIASGAYRLRKSACFQQSAMTCLTCHDPHDIPRGQEAVQRQAAICQSCHASVHPTGAPPVAGVSAGATCMDCHMPKRRTEDAVHVVMTDHYIQRKRAARDLLAPREEADSLGHGDYRGEVALYYPATLAPTPENDLYVAVAQVQQGSNLASGITRLEQAIEKYKPQRPEFYYELARAYAKTSSYDAVIRWSDEALRRDANFRPALKELATAAMANGDLARAALALEKAVALGPHDATALGDLGNVYLRQDKPDDAQRVLQRALAVDPDMPLANNTMGLAGLKKGQNDIAERHFRAAIRSQPDLAEAHNNLGNLLAGRRAYAEAGYHFEQAIRIDPNYVAALHSYGVVLALSHSYPGAVVQLRKAIQLAPNLAQARIDLGDVLAAMGRVNEAAREYEMAAKGPDAEARAAALAALRALGR
jgi:predicted CXXCH cytochrome family protein